MESLFALSPLDGRYSDKVEELKPFYSESGLMRYRILVEVEWFIYLCNKVKLSGTSVITPSNEKKLRDLYLNFDLTHAERIKMIEATTNHDVKAIEYYIKENIKGTPMEKISEFIHFGCTSEDINNISYALLIQAASYNVVVPYLIEVLTEIYNQAKKYKKDAMMSRTHGQPASPTTMGKEFINVVDRLYNQILAFETIPFKGKFNGAVGNYNAHSIAYPNIKWNEVNKKFVESLGLQFAAYSTQIECHDFMSEIFDAFKRMNNVLIDFSRDIWTYISLGYFKQRTKKGEIGSSAMPHKVNPIDFENAEGNLGLANSLFEYMSSKLPVSRMQRDLTDSTVQRNIGSAFGYSLIAYKSLLKGMNKILIDKKKLKSDLNETWELLAEALQTVMRRHKIENPYEKLKELTRGKQISKSDITKFLNNSGLPKREINRLKKLTPDKYIGIAEKLIDEYKLEIEKE